MMHLEAVARKLRIHLSETATALPWIGRRVESRSGVHSGCSACSPRRLIALDKWLSTSGGEEISNFSWCKRRRAILTLPAHYNRISLHQKLISIPYSVILYVNSSMFQRNSVVWLGYCIEFRDHCIRLLCLESQELVYITFETLNTVITVFVGDKFPEQFSTTASALFILKRKWSEQWSRLGLTTLL